MRGFSAELRRVLGFASICVLFGLLNGYMGWSLLAGGVLYIGWMLWQIRRLDKWLQNPVKQPPDASGIWGEIFDNIHRQQKRQRREKRELKSLINRVQEITGALRDGVVLLDSSGNIDWWNRAAARLIGLQGDDKGHAITNYLRNPRFVSYFEAGDYVEPLELPSPRFASKQLQYQITRFGRGERLLVVRDITQVHNLEVMRRDFVANVSHEMRTPLTVIRGYLETLIDSGSAPRGWDKPLEQMQSQSQRMSALISDLITLSKLETEDLEHTEQTVSLRPLIEQIEADARTLSGDKQQHIHFDCLGDIQLLGSEQELHSAFSNLVFNAVKYTPAESDIVLRLWRDEQGVHFQVKDSGEGFDPHHISRLTERFYRIDDHRNSSAGGTGLGLAIVKHVLLRHDAELKIESQPGRGSCFSCHFPLSRLVDSREATG